MIFTRLRLRRAALRFAAHGWPVTPGAWLDAERFDCGRPGCFTVACHPALERWEHAATHDPERVARWWQYAPHSVLLATGRAFDVLEVPATLGMLSMGSPRWSGGPVATTPSGRWMLLVQPDQPLHPELDRRLDVVRHARGSWIPAPPTLTPAGAVRWTVSPDEVGWRLPRSRDVQRTLIEALRRLTTARPHPAPYPTPLAA